jgi:predicted amidophosphoribosyltransferase
MITAVGRGRTVLGRLGAGLLDLLLPPRCLGCGVDIAEQGGLCAACWRGLVFLGPPQCRVCGFPLPHSAPAEPVCAACVARPPPFDRARAALRYDDGSRGLILAFKHSDRLESAATLGRWLIQAGRDLLADADLLVPVPLHRFRLLPIPEPRSLLRHRVQSIREYQVYYT